ncbi:uncharacterized protein LOC144137628 [Haemaphysalis longicornis]
MPKRKTPRRALIRQWTLNSPCYRIDGETVFCQPCGKKIPCEKKYHLAQHEKTAGHLANLKRDKPSTSKQSFLTTAFKDDRTNAFNVDLCEALVAANIPWTKIENPVLKQFLQKYCNHNVPSESTLWKNYLRPLYEQTLARMREELGDSCIWISVDETTDVKGRFVAHFLAGKLAAHEKTRAFLVCSKPLERTNGESVAFFVNESLKVLYPTGVEATKVLLLYTDAAAYMYKAAHLLKAFYPQMLHVTCLAHALHRVCEELRKHFTDVNELIGSAKAVFLKAPSRVRVFKEMLPDVPLPPEPVVTRWGTWLEAVEYYNCYFSDIKAVINGLPTDESVAVTKAQAVLSVNSLPGDLAYLCANFTLLADISKNLKLELRASTFWAAPAENRRAGNAGRRAVPAIEIDVGGREWSQHYGALCGCTLLSCRRLPASHADADGDDRGMAAVATTGSEHGEQRAKTLTLHKKLGGGRRPLQVVVRHDVAAGEEASNRLR